MRVCVCVCARFDRSGSPPFEIGLKFFVFSHFSFLSRSTRRPMDNALETVRDDDFVEYCLFVRPGDANEDAEELVKNINHLNTEVLEFVERLSGEYIWHKDRFNLIPRFCPSAELRQSFADTSDGNVISKFSLMVGCEPCFFIFQPYRQNCSHLCTRSILL